MEQNQAKLSLHHVGGREGGGLKVPARYDGDVVRVLYDADRDCLAQLAETEGASTIVLPYCLGRRREKRRFGLTLDPNMSALAPLDAAYADWSYFTMDPHRGPLDYVYGEAGRRVETRAVETVDLDSLLGDADADAPAPPPDFLSLDTQGSEYEILEGASATVSRFTLAVESEIAFHPLYQGQKLFGDLDQWLRSRGFVFARFTRLYEMTPVRAPLGQRGAGFHGFGEALWLRSFDTLETVEDEAARAAMAAKLAFLAIARGQFDYGAACLRRARERAWLADAPPSLRATAYFAFLEALDRALQTAPAVFPPTFAQRYDVDRSRARFAPGAAKPGFADWFPLAVDKLRADLRAMGAPRLCIAPCGGFVRDCAARLASGEAFAPVVFCDNRPDAHGAPPSSPISEIQADDFALIASRSSARPLWRQLVSERGLSPERILTLDDIAAGRWRFEPLIGRAPLERLLDEWGFGDVADELARRRAGQSFPAAP